MANTAICVVITFTGPRQGRVALTRGSVVIGEVDFSVDLDLDIALLGAVDKLCQEHTIDPLSLDTVLIHGDIDKNSSAYKVAQTFASALRLGKRNPGLPDST